MSRSIRKLVGGGAAALALGGFCALIVAPQLAGASSGSHRTIANAGVASVITKLRTEQTEAIEKRVVSTVHSAVTPTAACATAKTKLAAAMAKDKAEDATERTNATSDPNFKTSDVAEDKVEFTARQPLADAVRAACGFTKPAPSSQCGAALQSLKAAFKAEQGEDAAEKSAGTEGTLGDVTEDQTERSRMVPLFQAIRTSCVLDTHGAFSKVGSIRTLWFQH